jgi:hypothetical protein
MDPVVAQRRLDVVWRLVLRSVLLVQGALLLATLTVPMLGRDTDTDDSDPAQTLRVLGGLAAYLGATPSEFGDRDSHPFAVPGGGLVDPHPAGGAAGRAAGGRCLVVVSHRCQGGDG